MNRSMELRASARLRYSCRYTSSDFRVFIQDSHPAFSQGLALWLMLIRQPCAFSNCAAIHVNMPLVFPEPDQLQNMDAFEQAAVAALAHWEEKGSGYFKQQATRPQTLGYGLADSPVGQAAWIYEKMWAWTDNQGNPEDALTLDEMLDNIMLYWLPGNATSSARLYWESVANVAPTKLANVASTRLELPVGVS